jgi:hypothetical protein
MALEPLHDVVVPFLPGRVTAYPYLSREAERLARMLDLVEARWYQVFPANSYVLMTLSRVQEALARGVDTLQVTHDLVRAADLDLFGRQPYQQMIFQLDGTAHLQPLTRTALLRAASTYQLTGALAGLAASALLSESLPTGTHYAADVLNPETIEQLHGAPGILELDVFDGPIEAGVDIAEGIA